MLKVKLLSFLIVCFAVFVIGCTDQKMEAGKVNAQLPVFIQNSLSPDSGYITKQEGLPFLLKENLTDTVNSFWYQVAESDTIGKFYKVRATGNYFCSSINLSSKFTFETHLLFEISSNGELLKNEDFLHGNYPCCWENYYEGFNKVGDYFSLRTCGTGSGICAGYIWLFDQVKPKEQQNSIHESMWVSMPIAKSLSSRLEMQNGNLIMHYKLESGELDEEGDFNVKRVEKFDVTYYLKDGRWVTGDSIRMQEFGPW